MFTVWTSWRDKDKRLKVAAADELDMAMHYAYQYVDEGPVTVREKNHNLCVIQKDQKL